MKIGTQLAERQAKVFQLGRVYTSLLSKPHRMQLVLSKAAVARAWLWMFASPLNDNACAKR
ncbi:hypothetical protein V6D44_06750 [Bacillus sp. 0209A]|uniref:hypothetical protein n=1 Tax=Bacillus TaxID=1386 RepID=UPI002FDAC0F8